MACAVRFNFETGVQQFPLFMDVCFASTGEELASFLNSKPPEKCPTFRRLCPRQLSVPQNDGGRAGVSFSLRSFDALKDSGE